MTDGNKQGGKDGDIHEHEQVFIQGATAEETHYTRPRGVEPFVIKKDGDELLLVYSPKRGAQFVDMNIDLYDECRVAGGVFVFKKGDVKDLGAKFIGSRTFLLGKRDPANPDYFRMPKRLLEIKHDLLFFVDMEITPNWFFPYQVGASLSVFQKVARLIHEEIIIGGPKENAIPQELWERIVTQFPYRTEITYYIESRLENTLKEYLPSIKAGSSLLSRYLEKLRKKAPAENSSLNWNELDSYEFRKYELLRDLLNNMLKNETAHEADWEKLILRFILLLYPQYIHVERQLVIHERMTNPQKPTKRQLDLSLFDTEGHLDLIEIKRPAAGTLFRNSLDHDNNIPSLALSKTIMQIEKYILYLQKGGYALEKELNEKYPRLLPNATTIKIVNPRGLIVFGRSNSLSPAQLLDLEVLRRKFAHVTDIITYDDLLHRFDNILGKFKGRKRVRETDKLNDKS